MIERVNKIAIDTSSLIKRNKQIKLGRYLTKHHRIRKMKGDLIQYYHTKLIEILAYKKKSCFIMITKIKLKDKKNLRKFIKILSILIL